MSVVNATDLKVISLVRCDQGAGERSISNHSPTEAYHETVMRDVQVTTHERVKPSGARSAFTIFNSVAIIAAYAEYDKADNTKGTR